MDTAQSTALTVQQRASVALGASEHEKKLRELAKQSTEITVITNPAGYQQLHAARMVLKNERVALEKLGKSARDDATKFSKAVIEEEKRLIAIIEPEEKRLQGIQDEHDSRIERERLAKIEAEQKRVAEIQSRINDIRGCGAGSTPMTGSVVIGTVLEDVKAIAIDEEFAEFKAEAEQAKVATVVRLTQLREDALKYEAEQRQIRADREELDRRRAEEDERIRKQAEVDAAAARKRAEEDAARQAEFDRVAREARLKIEADERAAQERIAEQERVARLAREAEERKAADARAAHEKELREREEKLAAERRQVEEAQRKQREEEEAKARAAREAQEKVEAEARAKARAEQEAREAAAREEQRKADELLGIRQLMVALCDRCSDTKEFAPVVKAINGYFAKHGDPRRGEDHREAA